MPARAAFKLLVPKPLQPAAYSLATAPARLRILRTYGGLRRAPAAAARYLAAGRELDNFTYDIDNSDELAVFLADALGVAAAAATGAIREVEGDHDLRLRLEARLRRRPDREHRVRYGRRVGWYAVVRLRRPALVVATGVHDGLGAEVLLRALERNAAQGSPGTLVSIDVNPGAGWLVDESLRPRHELHLGDARTTLEHAIGGRRVDVFLHDSDHRYEHETFELETVLPVSGDGSVLMSDNAHASTAFADFCRRHGLDPHLFRERPRTHFYPGAGIGLAVVGRRANPASTASPAPPTTSRAG